MMAMGKCGTVKLCAGYTALTGPTKDTILDPCGTVEIPVASVVATMKVLK